jgi:hypothetical protein
MRLDIKSLHEINIIADDIIEYQEKLRTSLYAKLHITRKRFNYRPQESEI